MAGPQYSKKLYEMDRVDRAINDFAALDNPSPADLNKVRAVAQVESELDMYRVETLGMSSDELEEETHDSRRLSRFMEVSGDPRPHPLCDAHAIVSGVHKGAAELRAVLAWFQIRIDDPHNGCWLPRNTKALGQMPNRLRNAIPHSRIHRKKYYRWLRTLINMLVTRDREHLARTLKAVETRLQAGTIQSIMEP